MAFGNTGTAFDLAIKPISVGGLNIGQSQSHLKDRIHRSHLGTHRRFQILGIDLLKGLAARNTGLEDCGVIQCLPNRLQIGVYRVFTLLLHRFRTTQNNFESYGFTQCCGTIQTASLI